MKSGKKFLGIFAMAALAAGAGALTSCVSDEPFGSAGEADVCMRFVINSDVTRAEVDNEDLRANCVVYISSEKGLIHKYKGLENVPEVIRMKCGNYVAEAWTGDSVPASFDKKFYRGYMPFTVEAGVNSPVLKCGIANVVASVNVSSIDPSMMSDYKITIGHKNASLDFTAENVDDAKGYFMMPSGETQLTYTITGTNAEGRQFTKTGVISGKGPDGAVERAHEYVLNLSYDPSFEEIGGSFITVTISDEELLVEDEIEILGRPTLLGTDFDLNKQVVGNHGGFGDKIVKISGFGDITRLVIRDEKSNTPLPSSEINMLNLTSTTEKEIAALGISIDKSYSEERNLTTMYLTFGRKFMNALPEASEEYRINISATDSYGKTTDATLRVAVGEGAIVIDDPITVLPVDKNNLLQINARSAELYFTIEEEDVVNPGIEYKPSDAGDDAWTFVSVEGAVNNLRRRAVAQRRAPGKSYKISLPNLAPSTRYAYRAVADGFKSDVMYFTTESAFVIPNADMELWSKLSSNSKVTLPSGDGTVTFWDTGNHGSATMSKTLTEGSSDMFTSGSMSARLKSQFVGIGSIGKLAAGNMFIGSYDKTVGTDGELTFGRPYDGSHPKMLAVNVNYRPAKGESGKGADSKYIAAGQLDKGQIFVALATSSVEIRTKDQSQLFNPNAEEILAYGQYTFSSDYGPDGQLQRLEIPINYYEAAKTQKPLYLILVCTASKYGDYFSGGNGSLMYLDDFELVY